MSTRAELPSRWEWMRAAGASAQPGVSRTAQYSTTSPDTHNPRRAPAPAPTHRKHPQRRRRRTWGARRVVTLVLSVMLVYAAAIWLLFSFGIQRNSALAVTPSVISDGTNFLLVGTDTESPTEPGRVTSVMLLHVPLFGNPTLLTLPANSQVNIPGRGAGRLAGSYTAGGAGLLTRTVESATGIPVTNYVEMSYPALASAADRFGGVTLCLSHKYVDSEGASVPKGCRTMNGAAALAFLRAEDPQGEHSAQFLAALLGKPKNPMTWLQPWRFVPAANAAGRSLAVDDGTNMAVQARLALALSMVSVGMGTTETVPVAGPTSGQSVRWDAARAGEMFEPLR